MLVDKKFGFIDCCQCCVQVGLDGQCFLCFIVYWNNLCFVVFVENVDFVFVECGIQCFDIKGSQFGKVQVGGVKKFEYCCIVGSQNWIGFIVWFKQMSCFID